MHFIAVHSKGEMFMLQDATETKTCNMSLRMEPTEKTALILLAGLKGCSPSQVIRRLIAEAATRELGEAGN